MGRIARLRIVSSTLRTQHLRKTLGRHTRPAPLTPWVCRHLEPWPGLALSSGKPRGNVPHDTVVLTIRGPQDPIVSPTGPRVLSGGHLRGKILDGLAHWQVRSSRKRVLVERRAVGPTPTPSFYCSEALALFIAATESPSGHTRVGREGSLPVPTVFGVAGHRRAYPLGKRTIVARRSESSILSCSAETEVLEWSVSQRGTASHC